MNESRAETVDLSEYSHTDKGITGENEQTIRCTHIIIFKRFAQKKSEIVVGWIG